MRSAFSSQPFCCNRFWDLSSRVKCERPFFKRSLVCSWMRYCMKEESTLASGKWREELRVRGKEPKKKPFSPWMCLFEPGAAGCSVLQPPGTATWRWRGRHWAEKLYLQKEGWGERTQDSYSQFLLWRIWCSKCFAPVTRFCIKELTGEVIRRVLDTVEEDLILYTKL